SERSTPSVVSVDWETTNWTAAPGATAPAQLESKTASTSSLPPRLPGSGPSRMTFTEPPTSKMERKLLISEILIFDRPMTPIAIPLPLKGIGGDVKKLGTL